MWKLRMPFWDPIAYRPILYLHFSALLITWYKIENNERGQKLKNRTNEMTLNDVVNFIWWHKGRFQSFYIVYRNLPPLLFKFKTILPFPLLQCYPLLFRGATRMDWVQTQPAEKKKNWIRVGPKPSWNPSYPTKLNPRVFYRVGFGLGSY